jgi:hypothetical protein
MLAGGLQRKERFDILADHKTLEYFMTEKKLNARRLGPYIRRYYSLFVVSKHQQHFINMLLLTLL